MNGNEIELNEVLRGALARAYCTKENETKVLDPILIEAMVEEIKSAVFCIIRVH